MKIIEANSLTLLLEAFKILDANPNNYPDFKDWFLNKVIPGVFLNKDKVYLYSIRGEFIGVSAIKKGIVENKLRAVRVIDRFQSKGYGVGIIDHALKMLNDDKPLVSVSEPLMHNFSRIFINRYDFDLVYVHKDLYMNNSLEYQFNGFKDSLLKKSIVV